MTTNDDRRSDALPVSRELATPAIASCHSRSLTDSVLCTDAYALSSALAALQYSAAARVKHLFTAPTVAFRGVSLESITPFGGRVLVNLLVRNPNPYSLSTSGMTYELFVRDTVGRRARRRHVASHGRRTRLAARGASARREPARDSRCGERGRRLRDGAVSPRRRRHGRHADWYANRFPFDQKGEFAPVKPR